MPLAKIGLWQNWTIQIHPIKTQLTNYSAYGIAWYISFNPDMTFRIKVLEDRNFDKRLP